MLYSYLVEDSGKTGKNSAPAHVPGEQPSTTGETPSSPQSVSADQAAGGTLRLSLVLPCYNEVQNIEQTIRAAQAWFSEAKIDGQIIVTNDGSRDGTLELLGRLQSQMPNLKVVSHDTNQGYGAAVRSGCDQAEHEWIAFMDSDGQFHASDIALLLPAAAEVNFVTGVRQKRADKLQRRLNSWLYNLLVHRLLGVQPADINCGMKVFRRSIWPVIRPVYATGALVNAEIYCNLRQAKMPYKQIVVPHYPRLAGTPTGANLGVILRMFKELWRLKRSRRIVAAKAAAEVEPVPMAT